MKKCALFERCGGCKFDFTADNYKSEKSKLLDNLQTTGEPVWTESGNRRRADFAFGNGQFGFFESGTKNIIPVKNCPLLTDSINAILPDVIAMPWTGSGSVLVVECDNGIDISVVSAVPYFSMEFKKAARKIDAIRVVWNDVIINQKEQPQVRFGNKVVDYNPNAFLQPSTIGETALRDMVVSAAADSKKTADLFCGLGSFTYALNAIGFDIIGHNVIRDLFKKPLTVGELKKYDCVVLDPPRSGAQAQIKELSHSDVKTIIYVSCNAQSFIKDRQVLERGGFAMISLIAVDQFVGSVHWEFVSVFKKI